MPNILMRSLVWLAVMTVTVSPSATRVIVLSSMRWGFFPVGEVPVDGVPGVSVLT